MKEWSPGVLLHWFSDKPLMDLSRFSTSKHDTSSGTESLKHTSGDATSEDILFNCINSFLWVK